MDWETLIGCTDPPTHDGETEPVLGGDDFPEMTQSEDEEYDSHKDCTAAGLDGVIVAIESF